MPRTKKETDERTQAPDRDEERYEEREGREERGPECPICALMGALGGRKNRHPEFFGHLRRAEGEVLKAFRALIDERLEACQTEEKPRRATKIKVS